MTEPRDPVLHTAGLAAAEAAANLALRLSPHSQESLKGLAGQVLALECTRPTLTVYLHSDPQGKLHLRGIYEGPVTTRICGEISDFLALAQADDPAAALINGGIQLQGNSALLIDMQRILGALDIDWEAPLVDTIGDVAGHQLAQLLRGAFGWSRATGARLGRQVREFAQEEARLSPTRYELEDFYNDTQRLSERSERLAQRVENLRLRLERLRQA
jgi:ubiquinone biosynthesis protein UbiJ